MEKVEYIYGRKDATINGLPRSERLIDKHL